ncbi:ligand-binding sensor domain-containing protein [Motiliproteus sediminis]|uniref:ligand-binding sensor domain-containing protein n=1 Tax=Motiliproteus sediminis TaxID=1468178 RepID=UPI001AEFBB1D|nr:two-component regulator propeller domain-containing protein [Motiliproteus sediminis]
MTILTRALALLAVLALLSGCDSSDKSEPAANTRSDSATEDDLAQFLAARPEVKDVFNVGDSVYVRSLAVENESNTLWVGTSLGVHEIDLDSGQARNTFTRADGLANEYVFAIGIDPDGYKWFGTNAGGMSRYKDGEWKTYFPLHGLADYWIYAFANHPDGSLWVGTWAGANRLDRKTDEMDTYVKELINEWVYGLDVDAQGRVWFGTEGGVSRFDGKEWVAWTHEDGMGAPNATGLPFSTNTGLGTRSRHDLGVLAGGQATYNPNYVFALEVAADQSVWVGTWGGGVSRFAEGEWTNLTVADGLAGNIVYSVLQDSSGVFWFGTNAGVSRYDGRSWQTFNRGNGLPGNDVYALAEDARGDIWVGTRGGVSRIGLAGADK